MNLNEQQVKEDLKAVIIEECKRLGFEPTNSTRVMMHAHEIWQALVRSGKMPKNFTFDSMMTGMTSAALSNQFNKVFRGGRK